VAWMRSGDGCRRGLGGSDIFVLSPDPDNFDSES
jgi:hypothetical protein